MIANTWFEPGGPRGNRPMHRAYDERDPASTARAGGVGLASPRADARRADEAAWRTSRNVAVSAKDRLVTTMGGQAIDAAYWWKGGGFMTLPGRKLAPEAAAISAAGLTIRSGAPCLSPARTARRASPAGRRRQGQRRRRAPALGSLGVATGLRLACVPMRRSPISRWRWPAA